MALMQPPDESNKKHRSPLEAILPYTTVVVILAGLYVGWIFYSRSQENRAAQQALEAKQAEKNKRDMDLLYGSGEVKIISFSADKAIVAPGETIDLCYGVLNASSVKIDPPPGETLKPSYRHCMEVAPKKTTTYSLTATANSGEPKTASITVHVK